MNFEEFVVMSSKTIAWMIFSLSFSWLYFWLTGGWLKKKEQECLFDESDEEVWIVIDDEKS